MEEVKIISKIFWTEEEEKILIENYPYASQEELLKLLPRMGNFQRIRSRASKLGIKRKVTTPRKSSINTKRWSQEELTKLKKVYPVTPNIELEDLFTRSLKAIIAKANSLGLEKTSKTIQQDKENRLMAMTQGNKWSEEEEQILKDYYPTKGITGVGRLLPNRSKNSIRSKVIKMGITKNPGTSWKQSSISIDKKDIFSITVQYERIDR